MKTWRIPVVMKCDAIVEVQGETLEDAIDTLTDQLLDGFDGVIADEAKQVSYISGTMDIKEMPVRSIRTVYNREN